MITLKLKDISIGNKGFYGIGASSCKYEPSLPQYLRITDISDDSRISIPLPTSINVNDYPEYKDYFLNKNDIVFARTGNSTGRNYFYSGSTSGAGTFLSWRKPGNSCMTMKLIK